MRCIAQTQIPTSLKWRTTYCDYAALIRNCGLRPLAGIWNELAFSSTGMSLVRTSSRTSPQDLTEKLSSDSSKVSELKSL
jgi:hypothetical protein